MVTTFSLQTGYLSDTFGTLVGVRATWMSGVAAIDPCSSSDALFFVPIAPFGVDEHRFATYFDVHQGYRVLTHSHVSKKAPPRHMGLAFEFWLVPGSPPKKKKEGRRLKLSLLFQACEPGSRSHIRRVALKFLGGCTFFLFFFRTRKNLFRFRMVSGHGFRWESKLSFGNDSLAVWVLRVSLHPLEVVPRCCQGM